MIDDFERRFPTIWAACRTAGLDPTNDWLPVAPAAHYLSGGIVTDLDGASTLPHLWACGETACSGVHGANRLASNSLLDGLVFGQRVVAGIVVRSDHVVGESTSQSESLNSATQGLVTTLSIHRQKMGLRILSRPSLMRITRFPRSISWNEPPANSALNDDELLDTATRLAERLREFDVTGQMKQISPGPIFTTYAFQPDPQGIKYSRITGLADDLCLASRVYPLISSAFRARRSSL